MSELTIDAGAGRKAFRRQVAFLNRRKKQRRARCKS